jgi:hypothetical protein
LLGIEKNKNNGYYFYSCYYGCYGNEGYCGSNGSYSYHGYYGYFGKNGYCGFHDYFGRNGFCSYCGYFVIMAIRVMVAIKVF